MAQTAAERRQVHARQDVVRFLADAEVSLEAARDRADLPVSIYDAIGMALAAVAEASAKVTDEGWK